LIRVAVKPIAPIGEPLTMDQQTDTTELPAGRDETEAQWYARRGFSKSTYHKMKRKGLTPKLLEVPGFHVPRITPRADREWEERMKRLAQEDAAKLEQARRVDHARHAARVSVASPKHISRRRAAARAKRGAS
jgi:hypothetical protein